MGDLNFSMTGNAPAFFTFFTIFAVVMAVASSVVVIELKRRVLPSVVTVCITSILGALFCLLLNANILFSTNSHDWNSSYLEHAAGTIQNNYDISDIALKSFNDDKSIDLYVTSGKDNQARTCHYRPVSVIRTGYTWFPQMSSSYEVSGTMTCSTPLPK